MAEQMLVGVAVLTAAFFVVETIGGLFAKHVMNQPFLPMSIDFLIGVRIVGLISLVVGAAWCVGRLVLR